MKELAIHCTVYINGEDGWNEDNPMVDAAKAIEDIKFASVTNGCWDFDWQIYDAEVREP